MVSDVSPVVAEAFRHDLESCEVLCFAPIDGNALVSVLIVDSELPAPILTDKVGPNGLRYEVLSVPDLRTLYRLDRIEVSTAFLRKCIVIKDEYQDLFDAIQTLRFIVLDDQPLVSPRATVPDFVGDEQRFRSRPNAAVGYFSGFEIASSSSPDMSLGYSVLCTGVPQIHKFITRQCFALLEELREVTRSMEFAFHRNGRLPKSVFTLELYRLEHVNKAEFEKRLNLFCAARNRYPHSINFRLFRSNFSTDPRAPFVANVSRRILTEFYPRTSTSHDFTRAISRVVMPGLLCVLKRVDFEAARAQLDALVEKQLRHIIAHRSEVGELTNRERIAYQVDYNTDTMLFPEKARLQGELARHIMNWELPAGEGSEVLTAFIHWMERSRPSHQQALNLLFDAFCISPYRAYYFLRVLHVLMHEKA